MFEDFMPTFNYDDCGSWIDKKFLILFTRPLSLTFSYLRRDPKKKHRRKVNKKNLPSSEKSFFSRFAGVKWLTQKNTQRKKVVRYFKNVSNWIRRDPFPRFHIHKTKRKKSTFSIYIKAARLASNLLLFSRYKFILV